MKRPFLTLIVCIYVCISLGCTRIVKMEPRSGPPGTSVWVKSEGMWGSPSNFALKWDGQTINNSFTGTFTVPAGKPGKHIITLVDKIDSSEAGLIFPLFRMRHDWAIFTVTK